MKYSNEIYHRGFQALKSLKPDLKSLKSEIRTVAYYYPNYVQIAWKLSKWTPFHSVSVSFDSIINSGHFSYFRPNFRKISAQAPNFSLEITIYLNLKFSSKYQFKVIGTEIS